MAQEEFRDRPNRFGLAWSDRTTLHKFVTAADVALMVCLAVVLIVGVASTVRWSITGVVMLLVLGDYWLHWKRLGELGRR